jgi:uncharacterized protein YndB with AHSA1/START domain
VSEPEAPTYSESIHIAAPRAKVWDLVTAMERYGEWSSENTGGYWRKGIDGEPGTGLVGDRFVGVNRRDGTEWKGLVEIVERDDERAFAFVTGGTELNIVQWRYRLDDDGDGTRLTETWTLRNTEFYADRGGDAEIAQRAANAKESIGATLRGMKAAAEQA